MFVTENRWKKVRSSWNAAVTQTHRCRKVAPAGAAHAARIAIIKMAALQQRQHQKKQQQQNQMLNRISKPRIGNGNGGGGR
jgi:hypothetical protein